MRSLLALLLCAAAPPVFAASLDPSREITQYAIDVWQRAHGLPQNAVTAIAQTADGYLWLGTEEGLVRFDGVRFVVFDTSNTSALRNNDVQCLYAGRNGRLWVGTKGGGLTRVEAGTFTTYGPADGLRSNVVLAIHEDAQGTVRVGTRAGLHRVAGARLEPDGPAPLQSATVNAIAAGAEGTLWIGTERGVFELASAQVVHHTTANGLLSNEVRAILVAPDGTVWAGTNNGLNRLRDRRWTSLGVDEGLGSNLVVALLVDGAGTLWIGTRGGGLTRLTGTRLERAGTAEGLSHDDAIALYEDREGSLWIGTNNGGLNRLKNSSVTNIGTREGLSADIVLPVLAEADGTVWAGTYGRGLNRLQNGSVRIFTERDGLSSNVVLALHAAGGGLWIGTRSGIDRLEKGRVTNVMARVGLRPQAVHAILEDRGGTLWAGTRAGLIHVRDGRGTTFTTEDGLSNGFVSALFEARDGTIWAGTQGGGISRRVDGAWRVYSTRDGLRSDVVWSITEDAGGAIWVGTNGGGIARFDGARFIAYGTREGLLTDSIFTVLDDGAGSLWLSSNKGLLRVARKDFEAFDARRIARIAATWFDESDGMRSRECNGGIQPAGSRAADGRLLFPTIKGIVAVDPSRLVTNPVPPSVVIERAVVNATAVDATRFVRLARGRGQLEFAYTGLSFVAPAKVRFQYRLEGFDAAWIDVRGRREAYYTNIPPGTYTFHVRAANNDGVWNREGAAFAFALAPHFTQTYTFYVLLGAAVALAAFGAHTRRITGLQARAQNRERLLEAERQARVAAEHADRLKDEFLTTLSHELRTPLTAIVGWSKVVSMRRLAPDVAHAIAVIQRNAEAQTRLVEELLDVSSIVTRKMRLEVSRVDLRALLAGAVDAARPAAAAANITLESSIPDDLPPILGDPHRLQQVMGNLLSNAIKFTDRGGRVRLEARASGAEVVLSISDTGVGIAADVLPFVFNRFRQADSSATRMHGGLGLGLALVRDLVELHGGRVTAASAGLGRGSTFTVVLPVAAPSTSRMAGPSTSLRAGGNLDESGPPS